MKDNPKAARFEGLWQPAERESRTLTTPRGTKILREELAQDEWDLEDGRSANWAVEREFKGAYNVVARGNQSGRRLLRSRAGLAGNLGPLRAGQRSAALVVTAALFGIENLVGGN